MSKLAACALVAQLPPARKWRLLLIFMLLCTLPPPTGPTNVQLIIFFGASESPGRDQQLLLQPLFPTVTCLPRCRVYSVEMHAGVQPGCLALSVIQRKARAAAALQLPGVAAWVLLMRRGRFSAQVLRVSPGDPLR